MREVPWEEASRFGIMNTGEGNAIEEFEEKPAKPRSNKASMGVYIFTWEKLRKYLTEDAADPASSNEDVYKRQISFCPATYIHVQRSDPHEQ